MKFHFVAAIAESSAAIFNTCANFWTMSLNKMKTASRPVTNKTELSSSTKIERPSTANLAHSKIPSPQKSFIPTYRSLSQPPSISVMNDTSDSSPDNVASNSEKLNEDFKSSILESDMFNDVNMVTDEFKDCLESVKLELDSPSNTDFDTLNLGSETAADILKNLKTPDELDTPPVTERPQTRPQTREKSPKTQQRVAAARGSTPIRSLSRKNSNSGIPVSVSLSGKATKPSLQKQLSKRPLGSSPGSTPGSVSTLPSTKRLLPVTTIPDRTPNTALMVKRNLDMFLAKKKRYDTMRKDMQSKQKPLLDLYTALLQLKKKLYESGEQVAVDPMPPFETDGKPAMHSVEVEVASNCEIYNVDMQLLEDVQKSVEDIRQNSVELCKNMMEKRHSLLSAFESIAKVDGNSGALLHELELHKNESAALDCFLNKTIEEQERELKGMVTKLTQLKVTPPPVVQQEVQQPPPPPAEPREDISKELQERLNQITECEEKIKRLEKQLASTQKELKAAQTVTAAGQESGDALRTENDKLKQKISTLEKLIDSEKKKAAHEVDRVKTTEMSSKTLKAKLKDLENAKTQNETKITQLSSDLRSAHNKVKTAEKNFEKEVAELNKSRSLDKSVIERLNRDKSTFETRIAEAKQLMDEKEAEFAQKDGKMRQEVEFARQQCDVHVSTVAQMRVECENLRSELNTIHMHAKQSSELLRRKDDGKSSYTERECELQIEIVAQRAAIKALQEKVDANSMEKIRFIETIENLNGSTNEMHDDIVKTLVQKEEEITNLHQLLKKRDDDLANRRTELQNLKAKVENLQDHIQAMKLQENQSDLKNMIKEGRSKLEDALAKSLENEHKLIKFEHEMAQKIQSVAHLENTLKLRDGLIGVLKSKKEELTMENRSLNKYSEEIRKFVIEAKEELKEKTEIITQLQLALNEKIRDIHTLEKHMHQMEGQLALTNEKRYRLQDTVSMMERELQMVKSSEPSGEIRYDEHSTAVSAVGRLPCEVQEMNEVPECECVCDEYDGDGYSDGDRYEPLLVGLHPWQAASAVLYKQYRSAYHQHQRGRQRQHMSAGHSHSLGSISGRMSIENPAEELCYDARNSASGTFLLEDKPPATCVPMQMHTRAEQPSCQQLRQCYGNQNFQQCSCSCSCEFSNDSHYDHNGHGECGQFCAAPDNCVFGGGQYYQPMTFGRVDSYQVADSGHLVWLAPSATMQANNAIITRDLFAHSCTKIKNHLEDSLRRLNETRASYH